MDNENPGKMEDQAVGEKQPENGAKTSHVEKALDASTEDGATPSLGALLAAAREGRGLSLEKTAAEAHIPAHYLSMIESEDYTLVSDQLYLMPYVRRYAAFLGLDPDEFTTRFVREVQRAETSVAKISQPLIAKRQPGRKRWFGIAAAIILGIAIGLYFAAQHRRHLAAQNAASITTSAPAALAERSVSATGATRRRAISSSSSITLTLPLPAPAQMAPQPPAPAAPR